MLGSGLLFRRLRAPEPARERCRADGTALARTGITGRSARLADKVIALSIVKDIAARSRGELRPATLKGPLGRGRSGITSRLCHTRGKQ